MSKQLAVVMDQDRIILKYEGEKVKDKTMEIDDLANSLLGLRKLLTIIDERLYEGKIGLQVKVSAARQQNSIDLIIDVISAYTPSPIVTRS